MFDYTYPGTLPSAKGWGSGWPNCQTDKLTPLSIRDRNGQLIPFATHAWNAGEFEPVKFPGGVRTEIHELLTLILHECDRRGFDFLSPGCWGFACRSTKSSSGSLSERPSVHSWGLAIDINAPQNVFGATTHNLPDWLPPLFHRYGFRWLGPPIKDWMHFDFCGSRKDAAEMTERARIQLGTTYQFKGESYRRLSSLFEAMSENLRGKPGDFKVTVESVSKFGGEPW